MQGKVRRPFRDGPEEKGSRHFETHLGVSGAVPKKPEREKEGAPSCTGKAK